MLKEILVLALTICLINTQCQANYQIEGLETGTYLLNLGSITFNTDNKIVSSSQTYNHLFYSFFLSSPSIAIGKSNN